MLTNIFPPRKSMKNLIINSLINNHPDKGISVEEIRKIIKNQYNQSVTYQGINKILQALKKENIIENTNCLQ